MAQRRRVGILKRTGRGGLAFGIEAKAVVEDRDEV
jgi:hypothetical protein